MSLCLNKSSVILLIVELVRRSFHFLYMFSFICFSFRSHTVTLTLIGQCPMLDSSELFSYTRICSSFKSIEPLFFSNRVHRQTDTQTDGHKHRQTDTDTHRQTQTDTDTHTHTHTQTHTHTDTHAHRHTRTQTHTHTHTRTHAHAHAHTHTHTHTHSTL